MGEWPSWLRRCDRIRKYPVQIPVDARLRNPIHEALGDLWSRLDTMQCLTSGERGRPQNKDPKLTLRRRNSKLGKNRQIMNISNQNSQLIITL